MSELSTRREYLDSIKAKYWDQKETDGVVRLTIMGLNAPRILRYRDEKLIEAK